jgi:DNA/RNA endonuclease YhcR with UshA esterase domain
MRFTNKLALIFVLLPALSHAGCIRFIDAGKHIGETRCVAGKILRVEQDEQGITRLDFCEVVQGCPFTVVVFPGDLKRVGEIQQLEGKTIEIRGALKDYEGRAEIVLQKSRQLVTEDDDEDVPSLLSAYDVEEKGHYSAGTARAPKSKRVKTKKQTATLPIDVPVDSGSSD